MMRPVQTRDEYLALRGSEWQKSVLNAVRSGKEEQKTKLVQMNYSCLPNEDGSLKGTTRMSTTVGMDIDHIAPEEMPKVKERILQKKDELGLLMLELSARGGGYHLVFKRRPDLDQEGNLKWASDLLGVEYDSGAKDITRVFFTTSASEEDLLFLKDEIFDNSRYIEISKSRNFEMTKPRNFEMTKSRNLEMAKPRNLEMAKPEEESTPPLGGDRGGLGASPQSLAAFDLCVEKAGLKPDGMDVWGEYNWHNNLMAVLSVGVGKLMSRDQLQAVIHHRLPNYSQTEDCRKLLDYFYENYNADKGFMNASLRDINAQAQNSKLKIQNEEEADADLKRLTAGWNPPQLPSRLPRLIHLLVKPFPEQYHPVLVVTACVVLGTIASHFRGTYIDGRVIAANLYAAIIAGSGKGKSWVTRLLELMCRHTLQEWDEGEWRKVRENQEMRDRMANAKDKPAKYHPKLRIMETMSKTSLLEVQTNLGENGMILCNYTESDELANASRAQFSNLSVLLRKAWDLDKHRQFYMSEASCNTMCRLNAAILLTGTPKSVLSRLFADVESGMMQRFIPMMMPSLKRTFRPPKFMPLTSDEEAERDALLLKLWQKDLSLGEETLMLEMPKTQKVVEGWYDTLEERYNDGELTEAEADLSHRVGQFMQRAAIPFVALYGEEQREVMELVRWLGDFAYYNICHIFASRVAEEIKQSQQMLEARTDNRVTAEPLLNLMPEVFTIQQFREERIRKGQSPDVKMLLSRYCKSGKIQRMDKGVYRKRTEEVTGNR